MKLTEAQKAIARAAMAARMLAMDPATASDLSLVARKAIGAAPVRGGPSVCCHFADAWLQKQRRAGHIRHTRRGRQTVWAPTEAGRAALAAARLEGEGGRR